MDRRRFLIGCSTVLAIPIPFEAAAMTNSQLARHAMVKISNLLDGTETTLKIEDFSQFPLEQLQTTTPWTDEVDEFEGVYLSELASRFGQGATTVRAMAFNDYQIEFELRDAIEKEAFLAFRRNGAPMSRRDRGPFWVIFPWSQRPELDRRAVHGLSIWQLVDLSFH